MRVLVVEDDPSIASGLRRALVAARHAVVIAVDGRDADTRLSTEPFDLVVLDLGLPIHDGIDVLTQLRARRNHVNALVPVLVLSARGSSQARVRGLDAGADDYLSKPFDLPEFQARVRALLRRQQSGEVALGLLQWDRGRRQGRLGSQTMLLTAVETELFDALMRRPGRIIGKDELAVRIGSDGTNDNKVEVYVHRLRRKLSGSGVEIRTIRGVGYAVFEMPASA